MNKSPCLIDLESIETFLNNRSLPNCLELVISAIFDSLFSINTN